PARSWSTCLSSSKRNPVTSTPNNATPEAPMDMFEANRLQQLSSRAPLSTRMRPRSLDELVGQEHVIGEGTLLRKAIEADRLSSLILWGPPGAGKTTLARIVAS